jgi:hypothetical protein
LSLCFFCACDGRPAEAAAQRRIKLSVFLSATNADYEPTISSAGLSKKIDIGNRIGIGVSARMPVWGRIDWDSGLIYYLTEGSFNNAGGGTTSVGVYPIYTNLLYTLEHGLYFGGGANLSLWKLRGTAGGTPFDFGPTGNMGFQILGGYDMGNWLIELGYISQSGTHVDAGVTTNLQSNGWLLNGRVKL